MNKKFLKSAILALTLSASIFSANYVDAAKPITIAEQGSFTVGGTYKERPGKFSQENFVAEDGQRAYGDFAYVEYQKPVRAKKLPLIFQHGGAQSKRTWESGPDGREGFNTMFVRAGYSVYLVDQPRSGEANLSTEAVTPDTPWASNPMYGDKTLYVLSRIGHYDEAGNPVPNAQFPKGEKNYQAFQQSWTIGSGPLDNDLNADVLAALFDRIGPAILFGHSMGGTICWRTAIRTDKVKAIVAYEPGGTPFIFPETEMPEIIEARFKPLSASAMGVPMGDFLKLTKIPIVLYYGDYIDIDSENVGSSKWGSELDMAKKFVAAINRHGGQAELVELPKIGISGNSHFLMQEQNNEEIMKLALAWLKEKGLDK